jgi:hypothetical protein
MTAAVRLPLHYIRTWPQEEGEAETFAYKLTFKLIILTDRPTVFRIQEYFNNVTIFGVTTDGVWICDWIY